ncbi:MAG: cadherin-like beta sandwich domain-containing protein [Marinisporobacter sp.]|jgi:methionine-rich copper-binding protein CopC/uncharacterized protein YaiE (UPF0345 family)|nr:cadherin-like beta sandwich domain-containing protein [Marinisporobacter sp.]
MKSKNIRKIISIFIVITMIWGYIPFIHPNIFSAEGASAMAGAGTEGNPYRISSIEKLYEMRDDNSGWYYILMRDLDFNDNASYENPSDTSYGDINGDGSTEGIKKELTTGKGWSNALFKGHLDGNYHVIYNLYSNRAGGVGLFKSLDHGTTVKKFGIVNANLTKASGNGGVLASEIHGTTIQKVIATGTITSNGARNNGGLIGWAVDGTSTITDCYVNVGISANDNEAGGIVGFHTSNLTISDSIALGDITVPNGGGGIIGIAPNNYPTINIENNIAFMNKLSNVTVSAQVNRISGNGASHNLTLSNNYANANMTDHTNGTIISNDANSYDGKNMTSAELVDSNFYSTNLPTWDFNNTWKLTDEGPKLRGFEHNALELDGVDDYFHAPTTGYSTSKTYTVEMWIKPTSLKEGVHLWEGMSTSAPSMEGSSNRLVFLTNNSDPISTGILSIGEWHHIAATYDKTAKTKTLYVDGKMVNQLNGIDVSDTFGNKIYIGDRVGWSRQFPMDIDEVRIWNIARTGQQIRDNMYKELAGDEGGLVAYYDFDESKGNILEDKTTNHNDGTIVNGTWVNSGAMCPRVISLTDINTTGLTANWVEGKSTMTYTIQIDDDPNFTSPINIQAGADSNADTTIYSNKITGQNFPQNTKYYYRMYGEDEGWITPYSAVEEFMIEPGMAIEFDGVDDYISASDSATLDLDSAMTVEFWVEPLVNGYHTILCKSVSDGDENYRIVINPELNYIYWDYGTGDQYVGTKSADFSAKEWNHISVSVTKGNKGKIYLNGKEVVNYYHSQVAPDPLMVNDADLIIGKVFNDSSYSNVRLDELKIWNTERTPEQIKDNMYKGLEGTETGLVAYYNFNEKSGTTVPDITGNSNKGTVSGATWRTSEAMGPCITAITNVTNTSATFAWDKVEGATGYIIEIASDASFNNISKTENVNDGTTTSHSISGLTLGGNTECFIRMRAKVNDWQSPNSPTKSFFIKPGKALKFDGKGDNQPGKYIDLGTNPNFAGLTALTAEAWVKPDSTKTWQEVFHRQDNNGGSNSITLAISGGRNIYTYINSGTTNAKAVQINNVLEVGKWNHIAYSWNSSDGNIIVYVNGKIVGTDSGSTVATCDSGTGKAYIGTLSGTTEFFDGSIDEVRIWGDVRTQEEIRGSMHTELKGNETDLVAYYNFNEVNGTTLKDIIGSGYNGTLVNIEDNDWIKSEAMCPFITAVTNVNNTSATFVWEKVEGATGYIIDIASDASFSNILKTETVNDGIATRYSISGLNLSRNTEYFIRMRAKMNDWQSPNSATKSFFVQLGKALDFDGTDDYVDCGNVINGLSNFTIECWMKIDSFTEPNYMGPYCQANTVVQAGSSNISFCSGNSGNSFGFMGSSSDGSQTWIDMRQNIPFGTDKWKHIATVYDGTNMKTYVDGIEVNSKPESVDDNSMTNLTFGNEFDLLIGKNITYPQDSAREWYFDGQIDEFRIWNTARTKENIQATMHTELKGDEIGLVTYYNFNEARGMKLPDATGNNHNGILVNMADDDWVDSTVPTAHIISLNSTTPDGSYKTGDTVNITVEYNETVNVTGTPTLSLDSSATVNYKEGSGTSSLIFEYIVADGENSSDLEVTALNLNGGTIKSTDGRDALLTITKSLADTKAIVIDATVPAKPTIDSIDSKATDTVTTYDTTPSMIVSNVTIGDTIKVFNGETQLDSSMVTAVPYTLDLSTLTFDTYEITVKAVDGAGNESEASDSVSMTVAEPLSTDCEILSVSTPSDTTTNGTNITASVGNETTEITVDVTISNDATWKLYSDANCINETTNKKMNLNVGANKAYIKVTAEDGTTTKTYSITVTREEAPLSTDCEITSVSTPSGATKNGTNVTASVGNETTEITVDVTISNDATWKLYSDTSCINEITNKRMNLIVGGNKAYIKVTAEDGITTKTYSITVTRLMPEDVSAPSIIATNPINNEVDVEISKTITITFSENILAGLKIDRMTLKNGETVVEYVYGIDDNQLTINPKSDLKDETLYILNIPENTVTDYVYNQFENEYELKFTTEKIASNNTDLISVTTPSGAVKNGTNINASVVNETTEITVDVTISNDATWKLYSDASCINEITNKRMNLIVGANKAYIKVTAEDGITTKTYSITVTREEAPLSTDCEIIFVSTPNGAVKNGTNITASVENETAEITVDVTISNDATWKLYSDANCINEITNKRMHLNVGANRAYIKVTAEDGITNKTYSTTVTRLMPEDVSAPSIMATNPINNKVDVPVSKTITITFSENILAGSTIDRMTLKNGDTVVEYVYSIEDNQLTINPKSDLKDGTLYILNIPENTVTDYVYNSLEDKYVLNFTTKRILSSNADLSGINLSNVSLTPAFSPNKKEYTAKVDNSVSSITITPTKDDNNTKISVNGKEVISGHASESINLNVGSNIITIVVTAEDQTTKTYTIKVTREAKKDNEGSSSSGSSSSTTPSESEVQQGSKIIVNGEEQIAGEETIKEENGQKKIELVVDSEILNKKIKEVTMKEEVNNVVEIAVRAKDADQVGTILTGDIVKKMDEEELKLSIKTDEIDYIIPAKEVGIDQVSQILGVKMDSLKDIKVEVQIEKIDEKIVKEIEEKAKAQDYEVVFPPVEFKIIAKTTNDTGEVKSTEISKFKNYVERVMEIPEGVDPSKITTGIVYNADGTFSHIPTEVFKKGDKWFAKLNSLTNSSYSVIYNPVTVKSVENHWSKEYVNDLASRLVIKNPESFKPDESITRGEFAEYITKAIGVYRTKVAKSGQFIDIEVNNELADAITIAVEYDIIKGYPDGTFRPDGKINREEAMTMYAKAMDIVNLGEGDKNRIEDYKDKNQVSPWAYDFVKKTISANVFNGRTKETIAPQGTFTYAEASAAIENLLIESELINERKK